MTLVVVAMALALLFVALTAAAARGLLRVNGAVGLRTPATMRDQEAWQRAHAKALPVVAVTAGIVLVAGTVVVLAGERVGPRDAVGLAMVGATVVGLVVGAVVADRAAKRD